MSSPNNLLEQLAVNKLATLVEEATRATKDSPERFIEPAKGTLDRCKSKRHHLVFGRRGSGKTSLLRKTERDLSLTRTPVAFVDLEAFKGHHYPDVLLSVLIETLRSFSNWLDGFAINPASKTTFWKKIFGASPTKPPIPIQKAVSTKQSIASIVEELEQLLHGEDDISTRLTQETEQSRRLEEGASASLGGKAVGITYKDAEAENGRRLEQSVVELKRRKIDFLHRRIIDFQKLFSQIVSLSNGDAYVLLDDLYHIRKTDQPELLDYFHRIVKGRSVWLKVGTIRHRTEWYHHGNPPIGLKLGDDADDIDLDITLEKYTIARDFLLRILDNLMSEAGLEGHRQLLADGGVERLILASGGVARDFLTIFRRSIDVARERGVTARGERINAEDVNRAAGEHDASKRDELKRDTEDERVALENALQNIQQFCIGNNINCFLIEQTQAKAGGQIIGELVDLRFLHIVSSRTTVRDVQGKLYSAYMLDISQYTGDRSRKGMEMIQFWKREALDRLRRSKYVYPL